MNKYHNKKCFYKGMTFDSKKERDYYVILEMMLKNKQISDLRTQVKFELQPSFKFKGKTIRSINYIADFTYIKDEQLVIVDTKGYRTEVYKLKKKMRTQIKTKNKFKKNISVAASICIVGIGLSSVGVLNKSLAYNISL